MVLIVVKRITRSSPLGPLTSVPTFRCPATPFLKLYTSLNPPLPTFLVIIILSTGFHSGVHQITFNADLGASGGCNVRIFCVSVLTDCNGFEHGEDVAVAIYYNYVF